GARPLPAAPRVGREARPPPPRARARPVLLAGGARTGPVGLASEAPPLPQATRGLRPGPAPRARLRPGRHAAHRPFGAVGDERPPREVLGQHVPADADRHRGLLRQAPELAVPRARGRG